MNENEGRDIERAKAIEEQAGVWFARMDGENASGYLRPFNEWLAQSPDHIQIYDRMAKVHRETQFLCDEPGYGPDRDKLVRPAPIEPVSHGRYAGVGISALAASVIIGLTLGTAFYRRAQLASQAQEESVNVLTLTTNLGEIRQIRLADGSSITLDTGSRVEVALGSRKRKLQLVSGHLRLRIAPDTRPFEVDAGAGQITANQAVFDIGYVPGKKVTLQLISGQAAMQQAVPSALWSSSAQSLPIGQAFAYAGDQFDPTPLPPSANTLDTSDWPSGWVDCRSITLDALIALANRYSDKPVLLEGAGIGDLAVTGRFRIADSPSFLRNIADQFDLTVTREARVIYLRPK